METLQISTQLLNQIIGYLGTCPYGEVFQLVQSIQEQAIAQVPMPETKPEDTQVQ